MNTRNVPLVVPFLKVHGYVPYSMLTLEFTSCYTTVSAPCNILYNSALCSIEIPLKPISALNLTSGYSVHLKSECNDILKKNVSESSLFFPFFYYKKHVSNQNWYSNSGQQEWGVLFEISALNLTSGYSVHQLCQLKEVAWPNLHNFKARNWHKLKIWVAGKVLCLFI